MVNSKRHYTRRVTPRLLERKKFLIEHLRKEWEETERLTRREDVVRAAKAGAIALGKGFLVLLLIAGAVTVAAVAPNMFTVFGRAGGRRRYRIYIRRDSFQREAGVLKKQKFISLSKTSEDEYEVLLTSSGERRIVQRMFNGFKVRLQDSWDGIWRMILFDIPDKRKSAREGFRIKLKAAGFYPLQKSVFVFPYPCEEELKFLAALYGVGDCVRLAETNRVLHDQDLRAYFGL